MDCDLYYFGPEVTHKEQFFATQGAAKRMIPGIERFALKIEF